MDDTEARRMDQQDDLARFQEQFLLGEPGMIYLDGNSLGRLPRRTAERVQEAVHHEWGERLIRAWGEGWIEAPQRVGAKIAGILGAAPDEVTVTDSTSVNLYKLALAALQARPGRRKVVTDDLNFPTDLYILQGALRLAGAGYHLEVVRSPDGISVPLEALATAVDGETALVTLSHTAFKSGFVYDMPAVTDLAHRAGALMLWDVCHSAGAWPLALDACAVDLAVGCSYKYLNGGPGAPAFLFVRRDLQESLLSPIWGWWGQEGQFDFDLEYRPAPGIRRFLAGAPPVLSLLAIEPGVDLLLEAGIDRLRAKSVRQTEYLIRLWEQALRPFGFALNSPREASARGSHVSLGHPECRRISRALIEDMHVLPDFRGPDNLRLGIAPLYNSFTDIHEAVVRLRRVVEERLYEKY